MCVVSDKYICNNLKHLCGKKKKSWSVNRHVDYNLTPFNLFFSSSVNSIFSLHLMIILKPWCPHDLTPPLFLIAVHHLFLMWFECILSDILSSLQLSFRLRISASQCLISFRSLVEFILLYCQQEPFGNSIRGHIFQNAQGGDVCFTYEVRENIMAYQLNILSLEIHA